MKIKETILKDISSINLKGRFDANTSDAVESFIRERIEKGRSRFVLNMENVSFISSAGLRVVIIIARELRNEHQGDLHIAVLQPSVKRVFEISGLNNIFKIFDDEQTAIQAFSK
ncbi:MAG: STAS domain-containing protein [Deltaproteobacteria bacterium]|nr:STAS domain-containing protein [Deltaproteobacteria bacterium]